MKNGKDIQKMFLCYLGELFHYIDNHAITYFYR